MKREYRVTPWKKLWWEDKYYTHYRIHQKFDGLTMFQMHEWKYRDGTTHKEGWIIGPRIWAVST